MQLGGASGRRIGTGCLLPETGSLAAIVGALYPSQVTAHSESQSSVRTYVRFVRDHWRLIAAITVLAAALAFALSTQQPKQYRTSLQVLFRETTIDQMVAGVPVFENPQTTSSAGSEMTTNVTLLGSETVAKAVIRDLGLPDDVDSLLERVEVEQVGESNIGQITVRARDPREAQGIADKWGQVFIEQRKQADQAKLGSAIELLRERLQGRALSESSSGCRTRHARPVGAAGGAAAGPGRQRRGGAARGSAGRAVHAARGADGDHRRAARRFLGLGLAALRRALDRRVKDPEEVAAILSLPILAEISAAAFGKAATLAAAESGGSDEWHSTEEFRTLATNLRYIGDVEHRKTIAFTSAVPDEGKTMTATSLAVTLARMGRRTALVDGDLRRGRIHTYFGIHPNAGLTSVAAGLASAADAWRRSRSGPRAASSWSCPPARRPRTPCKSSRAAPSRSSCATHARTSTTSCSTRPRCWWSAMRSPCRAEWTLC